MPLVVLDIHRHSRPQDQDYFRRSREERFGRTLEEVVRDRESRLPAFRASSVLQCTRCVYPTETTVFPP